MYTGEERRTDHTELIALIAEAKRAAFRQAVIDKTITSLIVTMLGAIGIYALNYFNSHWIWNK